MSNVDKQSSEGELPVRLCNYTHVYYNDRITADLDFMEATATEDQIKRFRLRAGDVLLTKDSETADDIAVPSYVAEDLSQVLCGYHLAHLRPLPGVDGRFLFWALASRSTRDQFSISANGITRFGLRQDSFGEVEIPLPPPPRQRAIADYLDAETARIDALIDKKRRMTGLLEERFESLIWHEVAGAGHATKRASGLPWVGDIPAHWGTPTVSAHFDLQLGKMLNAEAASGPDQYPYLRNTNVRWDEFDLNDLATMQFDAQDRLRCELRAGDVLICEGGEVGRAAVWALKRFAQ